MLAGLITSTSSVCEDHTESVSEGDSKLDPAVVLSPTPPPPGPGGADGGDQGPPLCTAGTRPGAARGFPAPVVELGS